MPATRNVSCLVIIGGVKRAIRCSGWIIFYINCLIVSFSFRQNDMHAKQIKNIQLKNYQIKCRSVFKNSNDNLICIENLLALSVHYFEIFADHDICMILKSTFIG